MGTRSTIGVINNNGSVEMIYCHWDGYPEHNGRILLNYYSNTKKVRELMRLGDISSLEMNIGSKHDFDARTENECTAYGRDRGETGVASQIFNDKDDAMRNANSSYGAEYIYLWDIKHSRWLFTGLYSTRTLKTLTKHDCEEK